LISEAIDQTRGWFYTLHALGTLLFDSPAYRNCIVLGHVNDEQGRKMSKRLGNVVEPMAVIEETGADALRWYFCVNNPELSSRFSARLVREAAQGFLLPLWNALSFFTIYANLDGWRPGGGRRRRRAGAVRRAPGARPLGPPAPRPPGRARRPRAPGRLRTTEAARGLEEFLDDLTNWYIRRSRDRFWAPTAAPATAGDRPARRAPTAALYEVLTTLARLLAPFTPFVAEVLHGHLMRSQDDGARRASTSSRLARAPSGGGARRARSSRRHGAVQRIVAPRPRGPQHPRLKTRQPLAAVTLVTADELAAGPGEPFRRPPRATSSTSRASAGPRTARRTSTTRSSRSTPSSARASASG
jgi:isoleucyl-tRNA synthetase